VGTDDIAVGHRDCLYKEGEKRREKRVRSCRLYVDNSTGLPLGRSYTFLIPFIREGDWAPVMVVWLVTSAESER
jgi:hypothetical protein